MNKRYQDFVGSVEIAARDIQKIKTFEMKDLGLRGSHVSVLAVLHDHPAVTERMISDYSGLDKAAVSRTISFLEKNGLVAGEQESNQRRYADRLSLTTAGEEAAASMNGKIDRIVSEASADMSDIEREAFYTRLKDITAKIHAIAAQGKDR